MAAKVENSAVLVDIASSDDDEPKQPSTGNDLQQPGTSKQADGSKSTEVNYSDDWPDPERDSEGRIILDKNENIYIRKHLSDALQPHQLAGVRFLYNNTICSPARFRGTSGSGCVLAHSMGLGKTVQVITFIDVLFRCTSAKTILVLVPKNTLHNWAAEFDKWLPDASSLSAHWEFETDATRKFKLFVAGDSVKGLKDRHKIIANWRQSGGVLLLGYELYRILINAAFQSQQQQAAGSNVMGSARKKKKFAPAASGATFVDDDGVEVIDVEQLDEFRQMQRDNLVALQNPGPDVIICDEGHKIKEEKTHITKALKSIKTRRRIVMTGYPLQNNLDEYFCMVDFVRPGHLGNRKNFKAMYENSQCQPHLTAPIMRGLCADCTDEEKHYAKLRGHVLVEKLQQFVMRRSHNLLRAILPLNKEFVVLLRKSHAQKVLYQTFLKYTTSKDDNDVPMKANPVMAFAACLKIWNHPDLIFYTLHTADQGCPSAFADSQDIDLDEMADLAQANGNSNSNSGRSSCSSEPVVASSGAAMDISTGANQNAKRAVTSNPTSNGRPSTKSASGAASLFWASEVFEDIGYSPGYLNNGFKMAVAVEIVRSAVKLGEKMLIFSQSLHSLSLIEEYLSRLPFDDANGKTFTWRKNGNYLRMQGSTGDRERQRLITRFNQDSEILLFLISTRAGSLGTNLTSASRVIIFDCSWNPCHDSQAVCRVFRYGQSQRTYIYRLIVDNSLERVVFNRQLGKQGVFKRVVDDRAASTAVSRSDLDDLLQYDVGCLRGILEPKKDLDPPDLVQNTPREDQNGASGTGDDMSTLDDPLLEDIYTNCGLYFEGRPLLMENLLSDIDGKLSEEEKREARAMFQRDERELNMFGDVDYSADAVWRRNRTTEPAMSGPLRHNPYSLPAFGSMHLGYSNPYDPAVRASLPGMFVPHNVPAVGFSSAGGAARFHSPMPSAGVGLGAWGPGAVTPRPMPVLRRAADMESQSGPSISPPSVSQPIVRLIKTTAPSNLLSMTNPGQVRNIGANVPAYLCVSRTTGNVFLRLVDDPNREILNAKGSVYEQMARQLFGGPAPPAGTGLSDRRERAKKPIETVTLDSDSD